MFSGGNKTNSRQTKNLISIPGYLRPAVDAIISYVDDDLTGTVKTNKYGMASIPVYGCSVSLIVYHKKGNPVYKTVDLFSCTAREEKVVIKVDDACNFNLHFSNTVQFVYHYV